ncbi:rhomboid family intramembrane serine protease [Hyphomicrobium sp.]|uniref:rhomboid family intramembrane serine protease n=3 Tax=Hyphomicrobium sp. TaxID=82 RepID=UPI002BF00434|nr:rhomboid family intramembrane serine protease [Hyphomicrobium sp.]HRQ27232.1 rhomboid family intramembrane serine protease [Hyphomicrobium sp.]
MFVPIHDENSLKSIPFQYVTVSLIVVNVVVFMLSVVGGDMVAVASFGIIPKELFDTSLLPVPIEEQVSVRPTQLTLFTYMFFHGDVLHLAGNMLFLWVFGDNVEDAMGHLKFLAFYLMCGMFAGYMHAWIEPNSAIPLIGASGAVAGVIAAYLMLHPRVRVWVLAFKAIPLRISALLALGAWVIMQFVMVLLPQAGPVAWWAHVGGLIAGAVLVLVMRRPGVPLFDRHLKVA